MFAIGAFRAACLAGAAISTTITASAVAQAEASRDYDLPAQDLGVTLRAIAKEAGREIIYTPETVQGRRAPPLKGRFTFEEALRVAIGESGLTAEDRAGAVLIRGQDAAAAAAAAADTSTGMIVTGSRIRGAPSPSPVTVMTRRQLEEQGVSDLAGFTRVLPQNYTGGTNPGIAGGGAQGGQSNINNSAALNLRGLGPDATLTLINGHRIAYDALNQGIDIAAIPLGAVERIEVITDGASALYGSDAVGGVANIILRRDFSGLETAARIGGSTEGGNFQQEYGAVGGGRWSSGGFMAAIDYARTSPIYADQRDYTRGLDPTYTLTLRNRQLSGVVAGHQQLARGVELEIDGYATDRRSMKQTPFLHNASVFVNGLATRPELRAYAFTPTLRVQLPAGWEGRLSGTHAVSRTRIPSHRYLNGGVTPALATYENETTAAEAGFEGPLFALPGGDARLAIGAGTRQIVLDTDAAQTVNGQLVSLRKFTDSRNVVFAYGELSLPLIGPGSGMTLVRRLSVNAALRYERYRNLDEVATPKLGLSFEPVEDVTVRGSWGRSFKAPTLDQVNLVVQGALLPAAIFSPQPSPPLPAGAAVLLLGGGNPELRSEGATTWTASIGVRPRLLEGFHLETSYFHIDYHDRIGTPITGTLSALANPIYQHLIVFNPTAAQVSALVATLPLGLTNQTGRPFDPAAVGAIVDSSLRNTARVRAEGVDVTADYRIDMGARDRLRLSAAASYLKSDRQLTLGQPVLQLAGTVFNPPHWRGRAGAAWERQRTALAVFVNYVGRTRDTRFPDTQGPAAFVTLDLTAGWEAGAGQGPLRGLEVRLSALNLLNEKPSFIRNPDLASPPYDSTNQSPFGRFIGLSVRKLWR